MTNNTRNTIDETRFRDQMQFKEMDPKIYYGCTALIYLICVIPGLFVTDLGIVFNLITALTLSFLNFIWPGGFYLLAEKRYVSPEIR